jgi:hypothetical protein
VLKHIANTLPKKIEDLSSAERYEKINKNEQCGANLETLWRKDEECESDMEGFWLNDIHPRSDDLIEVKGNEPWFSFTKS